MVMMVVVVIVMIVVMVILAVKPGLKITAGQRSVTAQTFLLTGHFLTSPVILTGHT